MHDIPPHSPEPQPHEGGIRFHPQSTGTDLMRGGSGSTLSPQGTALMRGDQVPPTAHSPHERGIRFQVFWREIQIFK